MSVSEGSAPTPRKVARRNVASRVREHLPWLQSEIADGAIVDELLKALEEDHGIRVSKRNLEQILYRARKKARIGEAPVAATPTAPTVTAPRPVAVGPAAKTPAPAAPAASQTTDGGLADVLDPKKRDAFADKYVNQKPRLFAAKPQGEN